MPLSAIRRTLLRAALLTGFAVGIALPAWATPSASLSAVPSRVNAGGAFNLNGSWTEDDPSFAIVETRYERISPSPVVIYDSSPLTPIGPIGAVSAPGGTDVFRLTVISNSGLSATADASVYVNIPPTSNAGSNFSIRQFTTGQLNGSGLDSDGTVTGYSWTQTGGPPTTLSNNSIPNPTFTAPAGPATLVFSLTVTDNDNATSAATTVTVTVTQNQPPTAVPGGPYGPVREGLSIQLNGSGSFDPDGSIPANGYSWTGPGLTAGTNTATPTFTAPNVDHQQDFTVTLVVRDNDGAFSSPVSTVITVTNGAPPAVNAGQGGDAIELSSTTLSGIINDPDSQLPISYAWTQIAGTTCTIVNATGTISASAPLPATVLAQFISGNVNANTVVTFRLTATDAGGNTGFGDVSFTIQDVSGAAAGAVPLISGVKTFPSPFSPSRGGATIRYTLRSACDIHVIISDIFGREVRELSANAGQTGGTAGDNDLHWDGKNGDGEDVGNGAYIVQVRARDLNGAEGKATDRVGVRK